jgi:hypothetical protein
MLAGAESPDPSIATPALRAIGDIVLVKTLEQLRFQPDERIATAAARLLARVQLG